MDLSREYHHNDCINPRCKGSPSPHRLVCSVRPRWTAPTRAERELVVLLSMGADLASVYLLERGVL